ncbi:MAG TPA: methyltransferase domain-containing protein [Vicinamibacterales bacterium]|nr:methyltransferase domain-containing protein [Vicinamibacterales bacterium]
MHSGISLHGAGVLRRGFTVVAVATACWLAVAALHAAAQTRPLHGRLFAPIDLGLLEGPDRDLWQLPDEIMDSLGIAEGSVVADIGAGGGWFTVRLARRVGVNGIVYAEDIQPPMLEATMRRVAREGLGNVRRVMGTSENPRLPAGAIDAALIVDTYHEFDHRDALLRNIAKSLKPNGRIGVVDFKRDGLGPGPALEDRVDPDEVVRDAEAAGLRLVRRETFLPYQFLLVFSRPQPGPR